ncbi:MAG: class I SAM-dependent methyltransferase [Chloroflexota bacterium]|nr:class I SAM-dependent methyltransferase [Chloroflexota bacterium]
MLSDDRHTIEKYFDQEGRVRERRFLTDPILGYEQEARQRSINALLDGTYRQTLDAGCGNGRDIPMLLARSERVVACDLSEVMIQGAREKVDEMPPETRARVKLDRASVTDLPYADKTFDLIVCSEVLEHVPNWLAALKEFQRVLEPGGWLIVSTPNKLSMYGLTRYPGRFLFGSKHAYDKWKSYWEHRSALKNAGFQLSEARGACYLIGDLSYFRPFRWFVTRMLPAFKWAEHFLGRVPPFKLLGYMVVLKAQKPNG